MLDKRALVSLVGDIATAVLDLQRRVRALEDMSARHSQMLAVTPDPGRGCREDEPVWVDPGPGRAEICTVCGALRPTTIDTLADIPASWCDR